MVARAKLFITEPARTLALPTWRSYRNRSSSPSRYGNRSKAPGGNRRINPNVRGKKVCWGCGSPDHILSDRKCTPKLETIKTNITDYVESSGSAIDELAEQFVTLHARASQGVPLEQDDAPVRSDHSSPHVHFEEAVYNIDEANAIESRFAASFQNEPYDIQFVKNAEEASAVFDCSHISPSQAPEELKQPGFCVDIGAPRSAVGQLQLHITLLRYIGQKFDSAYALRSNSYRFGDVTVHSLGMVETVLADSFGT